MLHITPCRQAAHDVKFGWVASSFFSREILLSRSGILGGSR